MPNFKLESDFFPLFLSQIRKLEKSANLFILNYKWAKFQENQGTFFFYIHHSHSKYSTGKTSAGVGFTTLQNKSKVNCILSFYLHFTKYSTCKTSAGVSFTTLQDKSQVNFIKEFPYKLIWTPRKKDKRIPFKFIKTQHLKD